MHFRTPRMLWIQLLVSCWIPCVASTADLSPEERAARNAVRFFCDLEFVGSPERIDSVVFTDDEKAAELNGHARYGYVAGVLDIESDLMDIVAWYRIRSVKVAGDSGTARVEYQKLGEINGFGSYSERSRLTRAKKLVMEELKLVKKDGKWLVLDPPRPKVGRDPIVNVIMSLVTTVEDLDPPTPVMLNQGRFARDFLDQILSW